MSVNFTTCDQNCPQVQYPVHVQHTRPTHVILDDRSTIKGLFWGFVTMDMAAATMGAFSATATLVCSPFIIPPFTIAPIVTGLVTCCLASMTSSCLDNASYHLGSRKFIVVQ